MAYENPKDIIPGLAAATDLDGEQFKFVSITGDGLVSLNSTLAAPVDGILQDKPLQGQAASVAAAGVSKCVAGDVILAGALVTSDALGKAVTATTGQFFRGRAITAAGAAGELISVHLGLMGIAP